MPSFSSSPMPWWRQRWLWAAVVLQGLIFGVFFQLRFESGEWERMQEQLPVDATSAAWAKQIVETHGPGGLVVWWFDTHNEIKRYHRYARVLVDDEQSAYVDLSMEYQPGALAILLPPAWVSFGYEGYVTAFVWWCGILHIAGVVLTLQWCRGSAPWSAVMLGRAGVASGLFLLIFGGVAAARFDHVVPVLVIGSLLVLRRAEREDRTMLYAVGGALVAVGVLTKIVPGAVMLVVLAWLLGERPSRWVAKGGALIMGFGGMLLVLHGGFYARWGEAYLDSYRYHAERGLQIESTWAGWLRWGESGEVAFTHGAHHLITAATESVKLLSLGTFGVLALLLLSRVRGCVWSWFPATLGLILAAMITSTVLSPQYLLWLGGPVMTMAAVNPQWRPGAVLLLGAAGLSQALVPHFYDAMVAGSPLTLVLLNLRNGLLITLLIWIWRRWPVLAANE